MWGAARRVRVQFEPRDKCDGSTGRSERSTARMAEAKTCESLQLQKVVLESAQVISLAEVETDSLQDRSQVSALAEPVRMYIRALTCGVLSDQRYRPYVMRLQQTDSTAHCSGLPRLIALAVHWWKSRQAACRKPQLL